MMKRIWALLLGVVDVYKRQAVGIVSKSGRYGGGTYAHKDIAFEFASWLSPEFKLYIIRDYQRLKESEDHRLSLDWNVKRDVYKRQVSLAIPPLLL